MSSTSLASRALQTDSIDSRPQPTPPLLPAFLITGILLGAIIFIILWRHMIERRNMQREEDDPTWPSVGIATDGSQTTQTPKLWELQFSSNGAHATWGNIMPLSVTMLRGQGKPRLPRYLVPSDRPVSLFTRMFGGERREAPLPPPISLLTRTQNPWSESFITRLLGREPREPLPPPPPISVLTGTQRPAVPFPDEDEDDEDDGPVDRLQVVVLIALPHPRCSRRTSYLPEMESHPTTMAGIHDTEEPNTLPSPDKGKKRGPEKAASVSEGDWNEDEGGPLEVAFGATILPFEEDLGNKKTS